MNYNIESYLETLNAACLKLNINNSDVVISHGGAALFWGCKNFTNDIDVSIPEDVFNTLVKGDEINIINRPALNKETAVKSYIYKVGKGEVDFHCARLTDSNKELKEVGKSGFNVTSLKQTLIDYKKLNRDKDQDTINFLEKLV